MNKHQFANEVFDLLCQWITVGDLSITRYKGADHSMIRWDVKHNGESLTELYGISDYEAEFSESKEATAKRIVDVFRFNSRIRFCADAIDSFDTAAPTTPQNH